MEVMPSAPSDSGPFPICLTDITMQAARIRNPAAAVRTAGQVPAASFLRI